ncbi:MAG: ABC transporter permease [Longimicrobiales bacterium]
MNSLLLDIRHGIRMLWKEKAFTSTVLLTLAVCVGANAAIFSVIHTVLLEPLPFADADRLVIISNSYPGAGVPRASNGATDYFIRRERIRSFESIAQYQNSGHAVGDPSQTERTRTMRVTASFFPMLGVQPTLGRGFNEEEMDPGNGNVAILSHSYWLDRFGGDPGVLARDLRVNGSPYRVVGVLPADFRLPMNDQPRFFVPITYPFDRRGIDNWHSNDYEMWARLLPGATVEQARAENAALNTTLIAEWTVPNARQLLEDAGYETLVEPARDDLVRDVRATLYLLWGGAVFVLLIGCVNISSLILARSHVRLRETATRLAIGAPRPRLARQVLTHALMLAGLGGALGVLTGIAGIPLLSAMGAAELPRGAEIRMDATVLGFTLGLAVLAGIIFGAIPAIGLLRADLRSVLQTESRGGTADRRTLSVRTALVTAQVALAFVLLIGAGLMLASFRSAMAVRPGFQPDGLLTGFASLSGSRYADAPARLQFVESLLSEMRALPGVRTAGITTQLPFSGNNSSSIVLPEGYSPPPGESILSPLQTWVGGDYFEAMEIPLVEGRSFEAADGVGDRRVIILDEWLARRYFGDNSPLGKRMLWSAVPEMADEDDYFTVVGVVGTIKHNDLTAAPSDHVGAYYFPYRQGPGGFISLVLEVAGDPQGVVSPLRERVTRLDPELPIFDVSTMRGRIDVSLTSRRASMFLLLTFAGVALFLAVIGIYGVLAYAVAQRRREMGIRMALGSTAREIFMLVLGHGMRVTATGLIIGAVAAVLMGWLIQSLLFGVQPLEPGVVGSVAVILGAVALAACVVPALQATRVNPVRAIIGD